MPGCLAKQCSLRAGRTAHGCQRDPTLVQHGQLRKASAAVLRHLYLTGVVCEQARRMFCLQTLCLASVLLC